MQKFAQTGAIPRLYMENAANAVDVAEAMLAGEIGTLGINPRGEGLLALSAIREHVPEMVVGVVGIRTDEEFARVLDLDADFVSFSYAKAGWITDAKERGIETIVTCRTLQEAVSARDAGADAVRLIFTWEKPLQEELKIYERYMPAGFLVIGEMTDPEQIGLAISLPSVAAVETDWIRTHQREQVAAQCLALHNAVMGFSFAHVGINCEDLSETRTVTGRFGDLFSFPATDNPRGNSIYATSQIEVMKFMQLGTHGHIGVRTNSAERAALWLEKKGVGLRHETEKFLGGRLSNIYLQEEIGGFAVHLLQRR
ncbi:MAG: hypothetical protein IJ744_02325 [Lachnospiraceae bacterium]|nr:hypothetical protein [Lachnospiraceae bacterium]